MKTTLALRRSDIVVRKVLPTHLVAQRAFRDRSRYQRRDNKKALTDW